MNTTNDPSLQAWFGFRSRELARRQVTAFIQTCYPTVVQRDDLAQRLTSYAGAFQAYGYEVQQLTDPIQLMQRVVMIQTELQALFHLLFIPCTLMANLRGYVQRQLTAPWIQPAVRDYVVLALLVQLLSPMLDNQPDEHQAWSHLVTMLVPTLIDLTPQGWNRLVSELLGRQLPGGYEFQLMQELQRLATEVTVDAQAFLNIANTGGNRCVNL